MEDKTTRTCKRREASASTESSSAAGGAAAACFKKMKFDIDFCLEELKPPDSLTNFDPSFVISPDKIISPASSSNSAGFSAGGDFFSGHSTASLTSTNDSSLTLMNTLRFIDLEVKSSETESLSTCINNKFSRESSPSSAYYGDSTEEMESGAKTSRKVRLPAEKMPSQVEIDEFFAVAEKKEQKRFADKYNYDIAKDSPLEGRYQWVRLKP